MSTLYEKSENLWQTLNAVRMLAATGKPLDPETIGQLKAALDANNPSEHMAENIVTFEGLRFGSYLVQIDRMDMEDPGFPVLHPLVVERVSVNGPNQLLIKMP